MGGDRRPAFQFYPDDWRNDLNLQLCSLEARGLWIECMCLAHVGTPYGHLRAGGVVIGPRDLAGLVGAPASTIERCLAELERTGVFSRDGDGAMYSRRMVADAEKSAAYRASKVKAGRAGAASRWQGDGSDHGKGMAEGMADEWQDGDSLPSHDNGSPSPPPPPSPAPSPNSSRRAAEASALSKVLDCWGTMGLRPAVQAMSDQRRSNIVARVREHGEDKVATMLRNRKASRFLTYEYNHGKGAGIDWCFGPKNFLKVLEGNYNDDDTPDQADDGVWAVDTYRVADSVAHSSDPRWEEYLDYATSQPPRKALAFLDWREEVEF